MSENISSNVLFHFTRTFDKLAGILKNGFYPSYCPEYLIGDFQKGAAESKQAPSQAAPMVCFCDLPVSLINPHMDHYGHYGIGLEKDWGMAKGVAPVFYTHEYAQHFIPGSELNWGALGRQDSKDISNLRLLTAYMKPIEGYEWRNNKRSEEKVHFYDEREWRFVPRFPVGKNTFLSWHEYHGDSPEFDAAGLDAAKAVLKADHRLEFGWEDITYLIVPDDSHILKLAEIIREKFSPDQATIVTTAIMTTDRIAQDV